MAARQASRFKCQHQPHYLRVQRLAHTHAVRANQVELQGVELRLADALIGQFAKAGVYAVDRCVAVGRRLHDLRAGLNRHACRGR